MKTETMRRLAAPLTALMLLGGFTSLATSASAAEPQNLIPPDSKGSLSVHKYDQPVTYGEASKGMALSAQQVASLTPLAGATFQVTQVSNVKLATNAGWTDAERAVSKFDPFAASKSLTSNGFQLGTPSTASTDAAGLAKFASLPVGLYLVEETKAPPVGANQVVTKAMPFLVTVPLTDPAGLTKWVYDVHVYPKNVISAVTKTVTDASAVATGETVTYTINSDIPGGAVTTKYVVTDQLDTRLEHKSTQVSIGSTAVKDFTVKSEGGLVTVTLGTSARQQAYDALKKDATAKVSTTHTVLVKASGEIANDATLTFQRAGEVETKVPSPKVQTKFGGVNIFKHAAANKPLSGAVFQVWSSHKDDFSSAKQVTVSGKKEWTTDASGKAAVDGLRYSGFADGATVTQKSGKYNFYWLVETKAPVGYELLAEPIAFTVASPVASAPVIDVVNTPHNAGGALPLTGADGAVMFLLLGTALMAGGAAVKLASRNRGIIR